MSTLNLTRDLELLIADITTRVDELSHIDPKRLLVCVASTRGGGVHGTYAKIHPLRFAGGAQRCSVRRGRRLLTCTMPTITHRDAEMLYVIYFLVPRFLNLSRQEKLITVFHELYHIAPEFNGDIRRFPGRNYAHGSSTRRYNAHMARLVEAYLQDRPEEDLPSFLSADMATLRECHRAIVGRKMAAPRIKIEKQ